MGMGRRDWWRVEIEKEIGMRVVWKGGKQVLQAGGQQERERV